MKTTNGGFMILKVVTLNPAWPLIVKEVNATCYKQDIKFFNIDDSLMIHKKLLILVTLLWLSYPEGCLLYRITIMSTRHCVLTV